MTDGSEKKCPSCGKKVAEYHEFCPWCDAEFVGQETIVIPAQQVQSTTATGKELTCFSCNKSIEEYHEFCPWCDIELSNFDADVSSTGQEDVAISPSPDLPNLQGNMGDGATGLAEQFSPGDSRLQPIEPVHGMTGVAVVVCSGCGNQVNASFNVCNMCGVPLHTPAALHQVPQNSLAASVHSANVIPAYQNGYASSTYGHNHQLANQAVSPFGGISVEVPLQLYYLAGKRYEKDKLGVLEFHLVNSSNFPMRDVEITLHSKLISKDQISEKVSFMIAPGTEKQLNVTGFLPVMTGSDAIKLYITGAVPGVCEFHLISEIPVEVVGKKVEQSKPNINVNISSGGPLIVDMEETLAGVDVQKSEIEVQGQADWQQVAVYWNEEKMEEEARYFPSACIDSVLFNFQFNNIFHKMFSPEESPKAVISDEKGTVNYLFLGNLLNLGRQQETNHVLSILQPFGQYRDSNLKIGRQHCRISIVDNGVYLTDLSSNGVFMDGRRIQKNKDIRLKDNDIISIVNHLDLKIRIFTDGQDVISIAVERLNNKTNERYILVHRYVPCGGNEGLPIVFYGGGDIAGAFHYNIEAQAWGFREINPVNQSLNDLLIEKFQEFVFGNEKSWFSVL